jgi:hypothetical protein
MSIYQRLPGRSALNLPQSERYGWALGILGVLTGVGYVPAVASSWILYEIAFQENAFKWWMLLNVVAIPPGLMLVAWGNFFIRMSGRHFAEVVASPVELGARSFCLYLRSFDHDLRLSEIQKLPLLMSAVRAWYSIGRTEEEYLARVLERVGPMVTAGIPGGLAPYMGAKRMYLPADGWQQPVRELLLRARLVVIALGPGDGTMWELVEAMRIVPPEHLLLVVPMDHDEYQLFRTDAIAALRERSQVVERDTGEKWSPPRLPDYTGDREIPSRIQGLIHFSPEWEPAFVRLGSSPVVRLGSRVIHTKWFGGALNTAIAPILADRQLPAVTYPATRRDPVTRTLAKTRVFLSFDYEHDDDIMQLFVALSKNRDSPFHVVGWSTKHPPPAGKNTTRQQIRDADLVAILCGEHTDTASGISAEILIAREEETEYILLVGRARQARRCKKPSAAAGIDKMYTFTWPNLKKLMAGAR